MADNETSVVAAGVSAEVKVEEPEQNIKTEEAQLEQTAKKEETIGEKEENGIKQEEEAAVKVKKETKDKADADVKVKDDSNTSAKTEGSKKPKREYVNKNKFDPTVLPDSDDPAEIRKQVEFYFSESNLPFDKFLFGLVGKENKSVPLNLVASFKRMKRFPNRDTIVSALKESEMLELSGGAGEETLKRKVPLEITAVIPREVATAKGRWEHPIAVGPITDKAITRSIYAKGFGAENATTQIEIEKFFEPYGPINSVRLRRTDWKAFKGSVFVEFADEELVQKFMALEDKPTWEGKELMWKSKSDYVEEKIQDIKDGKVQPRNNNQKSHRGSNPQNGGQKKHDGNRGGDHRNGRENGRGRGRGGRDRGRGGRGRGRENKRVSGGREGFKKEDNGIPKLKSSADMKSDVDASPPQNGASKRKAVDEGEKELKKPKIEEQTV